MHEGPLFCHRPAAPGSVSTTISAAERVEKRISPLSGFNRSPVVHEDGKHEYQQHEAVILTQLDRHRGSVQQRHSDEARQLVIRECRRVCQYV